MCPSLIEIGSETAEKNSAQTDKQTDKQTDRHYENNGHLAVNQKCSQNLVFRPSGVSGKCRLAAEHSLRRRVSPLSLSRSLVSPL